MAMLQRYTGVKDIVQRNRLMIKLTFLAFEWVYAYVNNYIYWKWGCVLNYGKLKGENWPRLYRSKKVWKVTNGVAKNWLPKYHHLCWDVFSFACFLITISVYWTVVSIVCMKGDELSVQDRKENFEYKTFLIWKNTSEAPVFPRGPKCEIEGGN